jgi:hypothetical protein
MRKEFYFAYKIIFMEGVTVSDPLTSHILELDSEGGKWRGETWIPLRRRAFKTLSTFYSK